MTISQAAIIGRSHRLMQQNCHDFAITGTPRPGAAFGLILDGCGSKYQKSPSHNEVGAKLLGQFAANYLHRQLAVTNGNEVELLDGLFAACVSFLGGVVSMIPFEDKAGRERFVATHWLATLVGFVVLPETAVFFWQGDGYLCLNGDVTTLDSGNRPDYLAYRVLTGEENGRFQTQPIPNRGDITWLAVASDGWRPDLLAELVEPRSNLTLQRWLNIQAKKPGNFDDDGAVAVWWEND